jgi:hypothetical protein
VEQAKKKKGDNTTTQAFRDAEFAKVFRYIFLSLEKR